MVEEDKKWARPKQEPKGNVSIPLFMQAIFYCAVMLGIGLIVGWFSPNPFLKKPPPKSDFDDLVATTVPNKAKSAFDRDFPQTDSPVAPIPIGRYALVSNTPMARNIMLLDTVSGMTWTIYSGKDGFPEGWHEMRNSSLFH